MRITKKNVIPVPYQVWDKPKAGIYTISDKNVWE
jgi:hypothetical protein